MTSPPRRLVVMAANSSGATREIAASPGGLKWINISHADKAGWKEIQRRAPFVAPLTITGGPGLDEGQSAEVGSRSSLEDEVLRLRAAFPDGDVPRPDEWLGYLLKPEYFEFWQGQDNRLHDRIVYIPDAGSWVMKRISP